ncbi:substrate-binding domain-containing protein [Streptomyces sp. NPDC093085]|uniref:substrate-binding domain-containing protein n=1 Tax=Streptomyces sp. NPDC093085 TaxID=3155068 RepID=UPI00344307D6
MREPVELRRQRILAAVESRGAVKVTVLAAELEVSVVTVRRDVEELARAGRLRRGHGTARALGAAGPRPEAVPDPRTPGPPAEGGVVALVVPERHSYLYEAVHGARPVLEAAGFQIALHIAPKVPGGERPLVEQALESGARGLLIAPRWRGAADEEADYGWLAATEVPTVLMERRPRPGSALHALDVACSDHWYGVHLAVDHLVGLGHRRIVLAARDDSPTARSVRAAFAEIAAARPEVTRWPVALSAPDAGPAPGEGPGGAPRDRAPLDLAALLREHGATAAVLHGDVDALMLVQALAEQGVRVPQECSVVAYDDVVAALGSTPLTAVSPPKAAVGRAAAELLVRRLTLGPEEAGPVRRIELLPELKVRGSTQRLAAEDAGTGTGDRAGEGLSDAVPAPAPVPAPIPAPIPVQK